MLVLMSCSDYDLGTTQDHDGGGRRGDREPESDSDGTSTDTGGGSGTNTDTDTPDDEEDPSGKVDVVLIVDVAYWYDCYRVELPQRMAELVNALFDSGVDVAVSIATYDDYNVDGTWWVAYGGVPYILEVQMSTSRDEVLAVASGLEFNWGGDGPGTGWEAMLQATTGRGYDQDCDGSYDRDNDIKPYKDSSSDAFGGGVSGMRDGSTSGTGEVSGVGFRDGSKRVVAVFAENEMRDRAQGHELPTDACLGAASRSDAADAIGAVDAKFLGINAYEFQDEDSTLQEQLEDMASRTNSKIDGDNDGAVDDAAVLSGSWDWPSTQRLVEAIWDLTE